MENYKRKFEELQRCLLRIEKLYNWLIITWEWEDSFGSPKDLFMNFFRVWYELKENLKLLDWFWWYNWTVEVFCNNNETIWLSLDIANLKKHWKWNWKNRTNKKIWIINTWLIIFDPSWEKDRTNLTIEINNKKEDWLSLCKDIFNERNKFLTNNFL